MQHHHHYSGLSDSLKRVSLVGINQAVRRGDHRKPSFDNTSSPVSSIGGGGGGVDDDGQQSSNQSVAKFLQEQRLKESMRSQLKAEVTAEVQREVCLSFN